jgi:carboxypeptidase C (cathepsin A)
MNQGIVAAAVVLMAVATVAAQAEDPPRSETATAEARPMAPAHVETRHTLALGQRNLDYRAVAETIGLTDAKGTPTASIYTVAYLAENTGGPRPVAFVFNGGPGAAAVFLHLGALGPKIMETPASGRVPEPPVRLVDNPATWLAFTDLVFIDPVGTGFSRGEGKQDNPSKPFWNVEADLQSLGTVVRLWLTKHERWGSPTYLVGESYGGFRVAAMAKSLAHDEGVIVNGLVLVSPALDMLVVNPDVASLAAAAVELPSFAASAATLAGKTGFDAAPVERFALSDYLVGLATMKGVPAPGDKFIAKVADMIGLPADIVRRERGWVSGSIFTHELRRDQNEVLSLYDATIARPSPANPWDPTAGDPILDNSISAYTAAFNAYAPDMLGYRTELQYRVLPRNIPREWGFEAARHGEDGLGLALSGLQTMLLEYPATKVLIANGRYDLVTPYFSSRWLVDQLAVPDKVREAIQLRVYEGGHMMYLRPASRDALSADAAAFFADTATPAH